MLNEYLGNKNIFVILYVGSPIRERFPLSTDIGFPDIHFVKIN